MLRLIPLLLCISFSAFSAPDFFTILSAQHYVDPLPLMQQVEQRNIGLITEFSTTFDDESAEAIYKISVIAPYKEVKTLLVFNAKTAKLINETSMPFSSDDVGKLNAVVFMKINSISFSSALKQLISQRVVYLKRVKVDSDLGINYLQVELSDPQGNHVLAFDFDHQKPLPILKWH